MQRDIRPTGYKIHGKRGGWSDRQRTAVKLQPLHSLMDQPSEHPPVTLTPELRAAIARLSAVCEEIGTDLMAKWEVLGAAVTQLNEAIEQSQARSTDERD